MALAIKQPLLHELLLTSWVKPASLLSRLIGNLRACKYFPGPASISETLPSGNQQRWVQLVGVLPTA